MEYKKTKILLSVTILLISFSITTVLQQTPIAAATGDTAEECGERGGRWIASKGSMDKDGLCEESDPGNDGCPASTQPKWVETELFCIPAGGWEAKDDWCSENGWGAYNPESRSCTEEGMPFEECMEKCFIAFPHFEEAQCNELCGGGGEIDNCTPEMVSICEEQEMICDPETGECTDIPR